MTRRLDHERAESDRLSGEAASERLRARQLEREGDQLRNDLEEYRSGVLIVFWQSEIENKFAYTFAH